MLNDKTWLDLMGHLHSDAPRTSEHYRRRDFGNLELEISIDDPVMHTRPFTIKFAEELHADSDIHCFKVKKPAGKPAAGRIACPT